MKFKVYTVIQWKCLRLNIFCILFNGQDVNTCTRLLLFPRIIIKYISAKNLNYFTPRIIPPLQTNISFLSFRKNVAVLCDMQDKSYANFYYYFKTTLTMILIILIIKKFTQTVVFFIVHQFISKLYQILKYIEYALFLCTVQLN